MWLYYNWGLAYKNSNQIEKAIEAYQEGISQPLKDYLGDKSLESHNRAINPIFSNLIYLQKQSKSWTEVDKTYQRLLNVLDQACDYTHYARFLLLNQGDYTKALVMAEKADSKYCKKQSTRQILALGYLTKWHKEKETLSESERTQLYNKSQILIQNATQTVMDLALSAHTKDVIPELSKVGISIDIQDPKGGTPLLYAIAKNKFEAVKTLLELKANPNKVISKEGWTPLMVATANQNKELVALLLEFGADPTLQTTDGLTAESIAIMVGNKALADYIKQTKRI
jgi:tetratricopeptide (TPR) repeat protein